MTDRISFSHTSPSTSYYLEADLLSQNIAGNSSTVRCYIRAVNNGNSSSYFNGNGWHRGYCNGGLFRERNQTPFLPSGVPGGATRWRDGPYDVVVPHNSDGTKTVVLRMAISVGNDVSADLTLPTIPRASTPTFVGGTALTTGTSVAINTNRASSAFTHDITWHFGGVTDSVATGVGANTSWTPPHEMFVLTPNTASGSGYIRTVTKNGAVVVGSKDTAFTVTLADIPANRPTLSATATDPVTTPVNIPSVVAAFVQGQSKVRGTFTASAAPLGASIVARSFTIAGQTVNLTLPSTVADTPGVIGTSGASVPVVFTVTDSRGRSTSATVNINVLARSQPQVISASVARSTGAALNPSGVDLRVTINASASSLMVGTQKNRFWVKIYSSPKGANTWTLRNTVVNESSTMTYNGTSTVTMAGGFLITSSYDIKVEVSDRWTPVTNYPLSVSTAAVFMFWSATAVGIGKFPENGQLDVAGAIYGGSVFSGGVDVRRAASESLNGVVELATAAEVQAGSDTVRAVTPAGLASRTATDARMGIAELATQAEVNAGTDTTRIVVPSTLRNSVGSKLMIPSAVSGVGVSLSGHRVNFVSATNGSGINVDGVFTDEFTKYIIDVDISAVAAAATTLFMNFRKNGVLQSTALYTYGRIYNVGSTTVSVASNSQTSFEIAGGSSQVIASNVLSSEIEVSNVRSGGRAFVRAHTSHIVTAGAMVTIMSGYHNIGQTHDGFRLIPSASATITGSLTVRGFA